MPRKSTLPLPRYVLRKPSKATGTWAYYFNVPNWMRSKGCPITSEALGTDYREAVTRAETVLLPQLDSWRTGGASDATPDMVRAGTFGWLCDQFERSRKFRDLDIRTQRLHTYGLRMVLDYRLKDGRRLADVALASLNPKVVDQIFEALVTVRETVTAPDGTTTTVERERRTSINHAMKSSRRAWNVIARLEPAHVPAANPFARMGLRDTSKETPTATFEEMQAFVAAADSLGRASIGTGAMISYEWLQRVSHVFGAFEVAHYRPKERPDMVRVVHPKTGEEAWIPLFNVRGEPLYPELMQRLDAAKVDRIHGKMLLRDWLDETQGIALPWVAPKGGLDHLGHEARRIFEAAGLRPELSMTSFRHGGFTEGADSDLSDSELMAIGRHKSRKTLPRYAKRTVRQIEQAQEKRRANRTNRGEMSE